MRKAQHQPRRCLRLIPLILGAYGVFLGFGLVLAGLDGVDRVLGPVRLVLGLGMTGFGLLGIWDGVRDFIRPRAKPVLQSPTQYVLTDLAGNRTSNVTAEGIREEIEKMRAGEQDSFHLQLLTPLEVPGLGGLRQVSCLLHPSLTLLAFFQTPEDGWRLCARAVEPEEASVWFQQLLEGVQEFSGWETVEEVPGEPRESGEPEGRQFRAGVVQNQAGVYTAWHRRLTIAGEAWRNEHRFFAARDVELAAQGVYEGKYTYVTLEWGSSSFDLLPDREERLQVIWCTNIWEDKARRYFRKAGTINQVKFWLIQYLSEGYMDECWKEIPVPVKKKGRKQYG